MDPKLIQSISKFVYRKFPEMVGKKPRVRRQQRNGAKTARRDGREATTYLLTYKGKGKGPGGVTIPRSVRVVASPRGKILKVSTSKG